MKSSIYQLALRCKSISDNRIGIDKNLIPLRGMRYTDYAVKGSVEDYLDAISELCLALNEKYPIIGKELEQHRDSFKSERIVHFQLCKQL